MSIANLKPVIQPRRARPLLPCALALSLRLLHPQRAAGEDHAEFKYEFYKEADRRIKVNTGLFQFEKALGAATTVRGEVVYDSISGASPTGGPPPKGSDQVPLAELIETRKAGSLEVSQRWGRHTLTPQVAYSTESDYESFGASLKEAIEFNNRNTTLSLGVAHNYDRILAGNSPYLPAETVNHKNNTDVFFGLSQLLGPKTILTVNGTYGYTDGYLTDPYKGIRFDSFPDVDGTFIFGEKRPGYRSRGVLYASLTQYITPADASVELACRFHRDSFDITAHTVSLTWFQKVGKRLTLEPFVRFYDQGEASFYYDRVPAALGNPIPIFSNAGTPTYFSADYRLSALRSWTYGLKATLKVHDHLSLDAGYKRYEMRGRDGVTAQSAYPRADIVTAGLTLWF